MTNKNRISPAPNGRFGKIAALTPQKRQCEFGSYYPAGTLVKPPPRQAAGTLGASGRQSGWQETRNQNVRSRNLTQNKINF